VEWEAPHLIALKHAVSVRVAVDATAILFPPVPRSGVVRLAFEIAAGPVRAVVTLEFSHQIKLARLADKLEHSLLVTKASHLARPKWLDG